jgi:adenylate cyclase
MSEGTQRRLAAIVAADVVGYSRLMGVDEAGTLEAIRGHRAELIDPLIAQHGGRIVKTMGDGLLLEFPSVVNATQCALEIQEGMADRNADAPDEKRITLRIGVNLGDIIIEGDDILGDGVNVAARLQEIAEPGGIAISRRVHEDVQDRLAASFVDGGEQTLKNIARPVHVWCWSPAERDMPTPPPVAAVSLPLPDKPSIAVLPFANMSGDPEQEYFADGMTEDIITALSRVRWFFVIARNSSFSYKGQSPDIRDVAADLGVRYVLEGGVRKAGSRVRITAQLIDGATGNHIWAERYDRDLDDIFAVQDEITETISGALEPELGRAERRRAKELSSGNVDAWALLQRGMAHMHLRTKQGLEEAQHLFDRALTIEPDLVPALAGVAEACFMQIVEGYLSDEDAQRERALDFARRAVQLDPQDAHARYALARIHTIANDHRKAIPELEQAIQLNPSFAWAHYALGMAYGTTGRPEEAIHQIEQALRLSPNDPYRGRFLAHIGVSYILLKQHETALDWVDRSLREPDVRWSSYAMKLCILGYLGRFEEAAMAKADLLAMRPDIDLEFIFRHWPIGDQSARDYLFDGLEKGWRASH